MKTMQAIIAECCAFASALASDWILSAEGGSGDMFAILSLESFLLFFCGFDIGMPLASRLASAHKLL